MHAPPCPKAYLSYEREKWAEVWETLVAPELAGYGRWHWASHKSNSQSSYRPHFINIWGVQPKIAAKVFTIATYGDDDRRESLVLPWTGEHYVTKDFFYSIIPGDLSWYYFGDNATPKGSKGKRRGKAVPMPKPMTPIEW